WSAQQRLGGLGAVDAAGAVAQVLGEPGQVGEQPDDRQPHLGALQPGSLGLRVSTCTARDREAEAFARPPVRHRIAQQAAGERLDLLLPVVVLRPASHSGWATSSTLQAFCRSRAKYRASRACASTVSTTCSR